MTWSLFLYLVPTALVAVALVAFVGKSMTRLVAPAEKNTLLERGILCGILLVGAFAIYGVFLLEQSYFGYRDIGADTIDQYVLFYLQLLDNIREGTLGSWNFDFGLGSSSLAYQSWITDPFNLLLIPLGLSLGNEHLSLVLALLQMIKIVLSGLLFDRFLTAFCKTPLARIVGSSLFGFCGYLSLWGQHYWLGSILVVFMALLLLSEMLLERWTLPRFVGVCAMSALCMAWSPYCGFMMLLGLAIIELLLIINRAEGPHAVKGVFKQIGTLAVPVLCGCLISGFILVPYALFLFQDTGRVGSSSTPLATKAARFATEFVPFSWIPMILSRLLGTSLISSGATISTDLVTATESFPYVNCYELLSLGLSVGAIIFLVLFLHWAFTQLPRKQKVLVAVAALIVFLYCFNNFLPALFNVFAEPKYRSGFLVAVPLCMAIAVAWEQCVQPGKINPVALGIGSVLTLAVLVWSFVNTANNRLLCCVYLLCAVVLVGVLFWLPLARKGQTPGKIALILLALCLVGSTVADGFFTTNNRTACTADTFPEATQPNESTDTLEALAAIQQEDPGYYRIEKSYYDWTLYNDSMVEGYSGVQSYNSSTDGEVLNFLSQVIPSTTVYGTAYQLYLNDFDVSSVNDILGVKYLLSKEPLTLTSFTFYKQIGSVYIYRNDDACLLTGRSSTVTETEFEQLSQEDRVSTLATSIVVPDGTATPISTTQGSTINVTSTQLVEAESGMDATLEATEDTTVCLSIPHTNGWTIYVDGQEVPTFRADLGFIGFNVKAGMHTIQARYTAAGTTLGWALTVLGVVIAAAFGLAFFLLHRKKSN